MLQRRLATSDMCVGKLVEFQSNEVSFAEFLAFILSFITVLPFITARGSMSIIGWGKPELVVFSAAGEDVCHV